MARHVAKESSGSYENTSIIRHKTKERRRGTGVVVGGTEAGVGAGGAPGSVGTGSGSAEL